LWVCVVGLCCGFVLWVCVVGLCCGFVLWVLLWVCVVGLFCGFVLWVCRRTSQDRHILVSRNTIIVTKNTHFTKSPSQYKLACPHIRRCAKFANICTAFYKHVALQWRVTNTINLESYMIDTKATSARYLAPAEGVWRNGGTAPTVLKLSSILR